MNGDKKKKNIDRPVNEIKSWTHGVARHGAVNAVPWKHQANSKYTVIQHSLQWSQGRPHELDLRWNVEGKTKASSAQTVLPVNDMSIAKPGTEVAKKATTATISKRTACSPNQFLPGKLWQSFWNHSLESSLFFSMISWTGWSVIGKVNDRAMQSPTCSSIQHTCSAECVSFGARKKI